MINPSFKQSCDIVSLNINKIDYREMIKQRIKQIQEAYKWLRATYPQAFHIDRTQPLKVGIIRDLMHALDVTEDAHKPLKTMIRKAVRHHTHNRAYYESIIAGTYRYDLQGNQVQVITDTEKDYARQQIECIKANHARLQQIREQKKREQMVSNNNDIQQVDLNVQKKAQM